MNSLGTQNLWPVRTQTLTILLKFLPRYLSKLWKLMESVLRQGWMSARECVMQFALIAVTFIWWLIWVESDFLLFYRAAAMQPRSSDEQSVHPSVRRLSVCLSVCLCVKRVNCDKTKDASAHSFIPYEMPMHLVLRHEECLVGDGPFYLKFCAKLTHPFQKRLLPLDNRS